MAAFLGAALTLLLCSTVDARPSLQYGIQQQYPPVARVNRPFTFSLYPNTFVDSNNGTLSYSIQGNPSWLTFNPSTLTFGGTPNATLSGTWVAVTASSADGRTASDGFELVVSSSPAPVVLRPVSVQLPKVTTLPPTCVLTYNGALRVPPRWSFSVGFAYDTFSVVSNPSETIYYNAVQTDTVMLPSWLQFDSKTVTFDGVAPSVPGLYSITMFGSDRAYYGDVQQTFQIEVSAHEYDLKAPLPPANATVGGMVNYTIPISGFEIDYTPVVQNNLTFVLDLTGHPYLNFQPATGMLSGNLPSGSPAAGTSFALPLNVSSSYGDIISTNITVRVLAGLFTTSPLADIDLAYGQQFAIPLTTYLAASGSTDSISVALTPAEAGQWMSYDAGSRSLVGTVPSNPPSYQSIAIDVSATDSVTGVTDHEQLPVHLGSTASPGTSPTTGASGSDSTAAPGLQSASGGLSEPAKVGLAAAFGSLGGIALLVMLCICCRRCCSADRHDDKEVEVDDDATLHEAPVMVEKTKDGKAARYVDKHDISHPIPVTDEELRPRRMDLMRTMFQSRKSTSRQGDLDPPVAVASSGEEHGNVSGFETTDIDGSTWGSKSSSSYFYSDAESARRAGPSTAAPAQPQQRRDFMPRAAAAAAAAARFVGGGRRRSDVSPSPSRAPVGGIRLVSNPQGGTDTSSGDESAANLSDSMQFPSSLIRDAAIATAHLRTVDGQASSTQSSPTKARPRLIPFTSERSVTREGSPGPNRMLSQPALYGSDLGDEEAFADAEKRQSRPYEPPRTGDAIFFTTPRDTLDEPFGQQEPQRRRQRTLTNGSMTTLSEPGRKVVVVGESFLFTPTLKNPPTVSIGSPGRNGAARSTYMAVVERTDAEDDEALEWVALPDWLHFSDSALEFWGVPQERGSFHIVIIERKTGPGSPRRRQRSSVTSRRSTTGEIESEDIVARLWIDVVDKRMSLDTESLHVVRL